MNGVRKFIPFVFAAMLVFALALLLPQNSFADSITAGVNAARGDGQPADLFGGTGILTSVTNVLLFVAGALSVIMLIIGGLRYALSGGNSTAVTAAKNTVLYAIVGLVIAFVAFAAINFVLNTLAPGGTAGGTNV